MNASFFRLTAIALFVLLSIVCVNAQDDASDASSAHGRGGSKEDLPINIKESLANNRIAREKKQYDELLQHSEEAAKISQELEKSFSQNNKLSDEDQKKLDRLEKLAKKIHKEMNAEGDDDAAKQESLTSTQKALEQLNSDTAALFEELKKATRYSISVTAVQSSNAVIKIVRFLRFGEN